MLTVKGIKKIMLLIAAVLVLVLVILVVVLWILSPGKPKQFFGADGRILKNSISEKLFLDINGTQQGMFIKGENINNPVILYLHGGMPDYFLTENYPTFLEKNFTVVWWEQRGCGISYNSKAAHTTINQLIEDTKTLSRYLLKRFNKQKIYLLGHSGGSFIGINVIEQSPELYYAYIGMSQISNQHKSEFLAHRYMLNKYSELGNSKMVEKFKKMSFNEDSELPSEYIKIRDEAMHELGIGTMKNMKNVMTGLFLPSLLFSEYSLIEKYNLWMGKARSGISQNWNTISRTDLSKSKTSFSIPVYFIEGKYDYTTSYELAKEYFSKISAPVKGFYTFENSAHSPIFEEPVKLNEILVKDVLNKTTNLADTL